MAHARKNLACSAGYVRSGETRSVKGNTINYPDNRCINLFIKISSKISVHLFTFSSQGSSCSSPTYLLISISAFFSGKIPSHVAARLPRKYWVQNFRHFVTIRPPPPLFATYFLLFVTVRDYSSLFATIRHYSRLFVLFAVRYSLRCSLFAVRYSRLFAVRCSRLFAVRCSLFATIRYSLFGFSRHPRL